MNAIKQRILQRCGCQKSKCLSKQCKCKREEKECTKLCTCADCKNNSAHHTDKATDGNQSGESEDDSVDGHETDNDEQEADIDTRNVDIEFINEEDLHDDFVTLQEEFEENEFDYSDFMS